MHPYSLPRNSDNKMINPEKYYNKADLESGAINKWISLPLLSLCQFHSPVPLLNRIKITREIGTDQQNFGKNTKT